MIDRYADAVRARRAELRADRGRLTGGHRGELRSCLALARVTGSAALAADLAELGREVRAHVDHADRRGRAALPALVGDAARRLAAAAARRREPVLAAVRALAAERGLLPDLSWPGVPLGPAAAPPLPAPDPPARTATLLGAADGAGMWRLALLAAGLPVLSLPVLGLPVLGGRAVLLPITLVAIALAAGAAVLMRRAAADRARWRVWASEALTAVRVELGADLDAWLIAVEHAVAPDLDRRADLRRTAVDAELLSLEPDPDPVEIRHAAAPTHSP